MKKVLVITTDDSLVEGLESATSLEDIEFEEGLGWSAARDQLVARPYQAVCIDYASFRVEGLNSFVQLDNILQKDDTSGIVLLREETERAREFAETLDSLAEVVNLTDDTVRQFEKRLRRLVDRKDDPDEASAARRPRRPTTVEITLPDIARGDLDDISVARLVHVVAQQKLTGKLALVSDEMQRSFAFRDGDLLQKASVTISDSGYLKAAFAWSNGRYRFEPKDDISGETIDPYPILIRGALDHLDQRKAMNDLMGSMQKYVAPTDLWEERREHLSQFDDLTNFVGHCTGDKTLEEALSAIASSSLKGFQAGHFALECDLVALQDEPINGTIKLRFSGGDLSRAVSISGGLAADHSEPSTEDRESELREIYRKVDNASAYKVFDLWQGCGEEEVRNRFFKLVKRHHPDSYGGNISEEGKELAEKIFIKIKRSYSELLKQEDKQTVPPSESKTGDPLVEANESGLGESLESPSVTAMGSGRLDEPEEDSASEPEEEEKEEEQKEADDPLETLRPGDGDESSNQRNPGRPMAATDPNTSTLPSDQVPTADISDDERKKKLDQLRQRVKANRESQSNPGLKKESTLNPEERKKKLDQLRKSSSSKFEEKLKNLEPAENEEEAQQYFNRGYKAYKNEDHQKAKVYFTEAYDFDESNALYKTFYAYLLFLNDSSKRNKSRRLLTEALKAGNKQAQPDGHLFLGRLLKLEDKHKKAKKHFERSLQLNPDSIEAKRELRVYELREKSGGSLEDDDAESTIKNFLNKDLF